MVSNGIVDGSCRFSGRFLRILDLLRHFFTYPEPLGLWAHPLVWAAGGGAIGVAIILWRNRRAA